MTSIDPAPVLAHFESTFTSYLSQLSTATSSLPLAVPSSPLLVPGSTILPTLLQNPALNAWSDLVPLFRAIWGSAGRIESAQVTRGEEGMQCVCRLLERVGAPRMARLEAEERDGAVVWVRALRDATRERGKQAEPALETEAQDAVADQAQVPPLMEESSSDDQLPPKPAKQPTPGAAKAWAAPPALGSLTHPAPSESLASVPGSSHSRHIEAVERSLLPLPSKVTSHTPAIAPPNPETEPKRRPSSTSSSSSRQPTPSTSSTSKNGKPKRPKRSLSPITSAAPTIDRPQRARKLPPKLVDGQDKVPVAQEDEDGQRYEVGQAVMAKFPNWSWWPAVILDSATPTITTQGTQTPGSYLVKSIPDGGDWRWNPPSFLRPLTPTETSSIIANTVEYPPVSWKKDRTTLLTALAVAQQDGRLEEWLGSKTPLEKQLEVEAERRRLARIW